MATEEMSAPQAAWQAPKRPERVSYEGKSFAQYVDLKFIAEGAMGAVYKAVDPKLKRTVALKLLKADLIDRDFIERFEQEKSIMASLSISGIPALFDHGECEDQAFYAMEFIDGESLTQWLKSDHDLSDKIKAVSELTRIVVELHKEGVCHRDIKPDNVMVHPNGDLYLMDLGIAKSFDKSLQVHETVAGKVVGTPAYLAPELIRKEQKSRYSNDVYAVALVAYEVLTGEFPFEDKVDYKETLQDILTTEFKDAKSLNSKISKDVNRVLMSLLSKNEEERPSLEVFLAVLEKQEVFAEVERSRAWVIGIGSLINLIGISALFIFDERSGPVGVAAYFSLILILVVIALLISKKSFSKAKLTEKTITPLKSETELIQPEEDTVDIDSLYSLGKQYALGIDVEQDDEQAFKCYSEAAEEGHTKAIYNVATMYYKGKGTEQDIDQAIKYYELADERGIALATYALGLIYLKGKSGSVDLDKAVQYFRKGAEAEEESCLYNLAMLYQEGQGVEKDLAQAEELLERAASLGHAKAQYQLALIYKESRPEATEILLQKSAAQGYEPARKMLGE